jgi:ribosome-associated protein
VVALRKGAQHAASSGIPIAITVAAKRTPPKPSPAGRPKLRTSHVVAKKTVAVKKKASLKKPARAVTAPAKKAAMPARRELPPKESFAPRSKRTKSGNGQDSLASDASRVMAVDIATAALEKKAVGLEVLDVAGRIDYADFLVLMTGRSDRQVVALAEGIEEALRRKGKRALSVEGLPHAHWVVLDFGDVVVHVFQEGARNMYDLDGLWMDARRIPLPINSD